MINWILPSLTKILSSPQFSLDNCEVLVKNSKLVLIAGIQNHSHIKALFSSIIFSQFGY